jgi:hypothetical protein
VAGFELGILNLEALKSLSGKLVGAVNRAEFRTVEILRAIAGRKMVEVLSTDLDRRTGNLVKSANASIANAQPELTASGWSVRIGYGTGPSASYAHIQEEGGTIYPVKGKVLAVPVGEALTSTGRPRYGSPTEVEGGFWITARSGVPVFVARGVGGKGDNRGVLFIGLSKATITGVHAAERARQEAQGQSRAIFEREIAQAVA